MQYYLIVEGKREGPFSLEQLAAKNLARDSLVWSAGMADWRSASAVAELGPLLAQYPPPLPIVATPSPKTTRAPWRPERIAWLGLLCTPLWSAAMTVVNARRLGLTVPWLRVTGIVAASIAADLLFYWWWGEGLLRSSVLLVATQWGLWVSDLRAQAQEYGKQAKNVDEGSWLVPGIFGAPLALLTLIVYLIDPFLPLEPRQVCERFAAADTVTEWKKYSTPRLGPAVTAMAKWEDDDAGVAFALTDEQEAPATMGGGYLVGFVGSVEGANSGTIDGVFHLKQIGEEWKVDDVVFTEIDDRSLPQAIHLSTDYRALAPPQREQLRIGSSLTTWNIVSNTAKHNPAIAVAWLRLSWMSLLKLLAVVGAIGVGIRSVLTAKPSPKEQSHG